MLSGEFIPIFYGTLRQEFRMRNYFGRENLQTLKRSRERGTVNQNGFLATGKNFKLFDIRC